MNACQIEEKRHHVRRGPSGSHDVWYAVATCRTRCYARALAGEALMGTSELLAGAVPALFSGSGAAARRRGAGRDGGAPAAARSRRHAAPPCGGGHQHRRIPRAGQRLWEVVVSRFTLSSSCGGEIVSRGRGGKLHHMASALQAESSSCACFAGCCCCPTATRVKFLEPPTGSA